MIKHFIEKYISDEDKGPIELSPEVWKAFYTYTWPGNVRELENVIERAVVLSSGGIVTVEELPEEMIGTEAELDVDRFIPHNLPLPIALERIEEKLIRRALDQCSNVQSHAAEMLGITKSLIQHKMKKYNIAV